MQYYRKKLVDLPSQMGVAQADGSRSSEGRAGLLSFGPYLQLDAARYFAGFNVRRLSSVDPAAFILLDVVSENGTELIGSRKFRSEELLTDIHGLLGFEFDLSKDTHGLELRMSVSDGLIVNVTELKLFRL